MKTKVTLRCPRCQAEVSVPLIVETVLTQRVEYEVWLSAEVSVGHTSHRCTVQVRQEECVHRWMYDGNEQFCDECGRTA